MFYPAGALVLKAFAEYYRPFASAHLPIFIIIQSAQKRKYFIKVNCFAAEMMPCKSRERQPGGSA
jgi:hypothetical protein